MNRNIERIEKRYAGLGRLELFEAIDALEDLVQRQAHRELEDFIAPALARLVRLPSLDELGVDFHPELSRLGA